MQYHAYGIYEEFPIWHSYMPVLIVLLYLLLIVYPITRILHKAGFTRWIALFMIFPPLNIIILWMLAFAKWPNSQQSQ